MTDVKKLREKLKNASIAQRFYAALPGADRLQMMERLVVELRRREMRFVNTISEETGKSRLDAKGEFDATLERISYVSQDAREMFGTFIPAGWSGDTRNRMAIVMRVPVGVVAVIGPFNYPLFIPAGKAVAALVAGNAVMLKPSSFTPKTMLLFEEATKQACFPASIFQVVIGSGKEIGRELVKSPFVDAVSFTGSTAVGEEITRTAGIKRLQLELGGKGVAIVLEDADLKLAAKQIVEGTMKNAGQRCDAVSVVYYVGSANADWFVELVRDEAIGWAMRHQIQPLITEKATDFVDSLVSNAIADGAILKCGGRFRQTPSGKPERTRRRYMPTVLDHVLPTSEIARIETFGPVVPIVRLATEGEALHYHNSLPGGLDSSIFTKDISRAIALATRLRTGSVTINTAPCHGIGMFPYGGTGQSGIGKEGIGHSILEMTQLKTIVLPASEPSNTPEE